MDRVENGKFADPIEDVGKKARTLLSSMKHDENRSLKVPWEGRQNSPQSFESSGRSAYYNDVSTSHICAPPRLDAAQRVGADEIN